MNTPSPASIGSWLSIGSPVIAELAAACGFDWLLFDLEHGCTSEAALPDQLRALNGTTTRAIIRVGAPHPDLIGRVLDWGAHGIMVPHVNSAEEAHRCLQAMHYSPHGKRGFSRSARAYRYGLKPPGKVEDITAPLFLPQIETIEGVRNASEIAAVPGVDVLFVGPADLQFDLQARPMAADCDFETCLVRVTEAARLAGKHSGILVRDPSDLPRMLSLGFTQIAIESDLSILRKGWLEIIKAARS